MTIQDRVFNVVNSNFDTAYSRDTLVGKGQPSAWDSLKHIEIIFSLESEFGVRFEAEEIANLQTLNDIGQLISEKVSDAP